MLKVPGVAAVLLVLPVMFLEVPRAALIAASVCSFIVAFLGGMYSYFLLENDSCDQDSSWTPVNSTLINATDVSDRHNAFCDNKDYWTEMDLLSTVLWTLTAIFILKIPSPGQYVEGQRQEDCQEVSLR